MAVNADPRASGPRGVVPERIAEIIRETRAREPWIRYDSILVYAGANALDTGWYSNFATFANATRLVWFGGRSSNVGEAWSNQQTEREDWAFDAHQWGVEFFAPVGNADYDDQASEVAWFNNFWVSELPRGTAFNMDIANADNLVKAPGSYLPPGYGPRGGVTDGSGGQFSQPGNQGEAHVTNTWKFGKPLMIPASAQIRVTARIDDIYKTFLRGFPNCPSYTNVPCDAGDPPGSGADTERLPKIFGIRVFLRGYRYLQPRGAREAS